LVKFWFLKHAERHERRKVMKELVETAGGYPVPKYVQLHCLYIGDEVVQCICKDGEPWFLVQDLARLLELTNIRVNLRQVPKEEKSMCYATISVGVLKEQRKRMSVVNEAGLYRLIFMSHTEMAKTFKTWVVREVLPTIRRTGRYKHKKDNMLIKAKGSDPFRAAIKTRFRPLEWIEESENEVKVAT